jgi:pimeloyl-ACP methyl ester carboxylesterase
MTRLAAVVAMMLAVAIVVVAAVPALRARAKAVTVLADATGLQLPRPLAYTVERQDAVVGPARGHLYVPVVRGRPALVLVPGATRAGLEDRRAVDAATALARAGRTVFVPDLALYRWELERGDIASVRGAADALAEATGGPVVLFGFSYGGALALLAAAGLPRDGPVAQVAVFGAYADLVGVVQAVTTGVSVVDGERFDWRGDPQARQILTGVVARLAPPHERETLVAAVRGELDPDDLGPEARALHDLVTNEDPDRTRELAGRTAPQVRRLLRRFSPSEVADRIHVPVIALHSLDDPAVPQAETVRLAAALPQTRVVTVELFRHVDLIGERGLVGWIRALPDLARVARFGGWLLAVQEPWVPAPPAATAAERLTLRARTPPAPSPAFPAAERRAATAPRRAA